MKKTILFLLLFALVSTCCVTNAMAVPKITEVHGGYGVSATVVNATGRHWVINLQGSHIFLGMTTVGVITSDYATIRTSIFPPTLGVGKIHIKITIYRTIIPVAIEEHTAFMLGPFVLFVQ
jgi:mannose/fructose/N-acetylgalactosamine-specific phosphotransferase system component IID